MSLHMNITEYISTYLNTYEYEILNITDYISEYAYLNIMTI